MKTTYKYSSKKPFSIGFEILIGICVLLTIGRWLSVFITDFAIINAEIHSHISNLSLSMIVYLGMGYSWILSGVKFHFTAILGLVLIAANFVCETVISFMNTPDIIDAIYGTIGITIVFVFLACTKKYGLLSADSEKQ